MADIINASSGYQTGSIDTATTLVNNVSPTDAKHINGPAGAIVQIETILGSGTTLKGSTADLATRLAVGLDSAGLLKLSTDASISGPLNPAKGGTGLATITDGAVMVGNGTGNVVPVALPSAPRVLCHSGTAGQDPSWLTGLLYHGPTSFGTGSTCTHEGTVVVSSNGNYSGIHYYTDFTLNSSTTMTIPGGSGRLIIIASGTITINGTISGVGGGYAAVGTGGSAGGDGTDQAAGGGGSSGAGGGAATTGGSAVDFLFNNRVLSAGTAGGTYGGAGASTPTQVTGDSHPYLNNIMNVWGGAAGAASTGNGAGAGGRGGASLVLIAPTIVLAASGTINLSGANGANGNSAGGGGDYGGGGGGGSGNLIVITRSWTSSGTITLNGGTGGTAYFSGVGYGAGNGSAGAAGVKQINIYA